MFPSIVTTIVLTALVAGGISFLYLKHQTDIKQADLQNQITALQKQIGTPTPPAAATPSPSTPTVAACLPANLTATLTAQVGGGTAGTSYYNLTLTNKGTVDCTVTTDPPTIAALNASGTVVGTTAPTPDSTTHLTVAPARSVYTSVGFPNPATFTSGVCKPIKSLKITLPGQTAGVTVANVDTLSTYTARHLLYVTSPTPSPSNLGQGSLGRKAASPPRPAGVSTEQKSIYIAQCPAPTSGTGQGGL
ncbi:MAG: DUF4232 domain-containing protein [bacterium]